MVETLIAFLLPVLLFGVNTTFWNGVEIGRYVAERSSGRHRRTKREGEWDLVIMIHPDGRSYNGSPILDTTYRRFSR